MSFSAAGLTLLKSTVGGGPRIWYYSSADAHTDVDATDYFAKMGFGTLSDGTTKGMEVGDVVYVVNTSGYTITTHAVSAVDSEGNATISAAVLA